jgi:hypothetical protein
MWAREDKEKRKGWHQEWVPDSEAWPPYAPDFPDIEEIRKQSGVDQNMEMTEKLFDTEEEFFAHGKEIARELDANEGHYDPLDIPVLENEETWASRVIDEAQEGEALSLKKKLTTYLRRLSRLNKILPTLSSLFKKKN